MKTKKVPLRICVACGTKRPKKEMIRVVKTPNKVEIDFTGKKSGRGAYLCLKRECIELAKKRGGLSKALKSEIPFEIFNELENLLSTGGDTNGED